MSRIIRDDLSERLIHLTKGDGQTPLHALLTMMNTRKIKGGSGFIMGSHHCVCFSETPISAIGMIIAAEHQFFKYSAYGLIFKKSWVFANGGLAVIYQPRTDYDLLPDSKKHLHVSFDLTSNPTTDFTWEREWRVKCADLPFTPEDATVIVPSRTISDTLRKLYNQEIKKNIEQGKDEDVDVDPWHYTVLEDLGVTVKHDVPK